MLAYHTALSRGTDVDKQENLAKSVTVEVAGIDEMSLRHNISSRDGADLTTGAGRLVR